MLSMPYIYQRPWSIGGPCIPYYAKLRALSGNVQAQSPSDGYTDGESPVPTDNFSERALLTESFFGVDFPHAKNWRYAPVTQPGCQGKSPASEHAIMAHS